MVTIFSSDYMTGEKRELSFIHFTHGFRSLQMHFTSRLTSSPLKIGHDQTSVFQRANDPITRYITAQWIALLVLSQFIH